MTAWLNVGPHELTGLKVLPKRELENAGSFSGGKFKVVWHTAEGSSISGTYSAVAGKRAAPHFILDPKLGQVVQCVGLDLSARALEHPAGTAETNRACAIQVEIVGFSDLNLAKSSRAEDRWVGNFGDKEWDAIAGLGYLIRRHVPVANKVRNFTEPKKFGEQEFVNFSGHCGHIHVPHNEHWDPSTHFRGQKVVDRIKRLEARKAR